MVKMIIVENFMTLASSLNHINGIQDSMCHVFFPPPLYANYTQEELRIIGILFAIVEVSQGGKKSMIYTQEHN